MEWRATQLAAQQHFSTHKGQVRSRDAALHNTAQIGLLAVTLQSSPLRFPHPDNLTPPPQPPMLKHSPHGRPARPFTCAKAGPVWPPRAPAGEGMAVVTMVAIRVWLPAGQSVQFHIPHRKAHPDEAVSASGIRQGPGECNC